MNDTAAESDSARQRHRPPMLNLDSQAKPASQHATHSLTGINLSSHNRNSATRTTTLSATPANAVFPALRTPKDIVLQDITLQCISPALPSFGATVYDAMARSKTIQEEQRKLIAQRIQEDSTEKDDYLGHIRQGISSPPPTDPSNPSSANEETSGPKSRGDLAPEKPRLIVSDSGIIIETTPTPTDASLKVTSTARGPISIRRRKARPQRIELYPYTRGPSIQSAPPRNAPYSPHVLTGARQQQLFRRNLQLKGAHTNGNLISSVNALKSSPHVFSYRRSGEQYPPLTAVPGSYTTGRYSGWPSFAQHRKPVFKGAERPGDGEEEEEEEEEDDGRDPEDAALSDHETDDRERKAAVAAAAAGATKKPVPVVEEEDEDSYIESRAIGEDDERQFQRKARRRQQSQQSAVAAAASAAKRERPSEGLKEEQLKKQRFFELCSDLWDVLRS